MDKMKIVGKRKFISKVICFQNKRLLNALSTVTKESSEHQCSPDSFVTPVRQLRGEFVYFDK